MKYNVLFVFFCMWATPALAIEVTSVRTVTVSGEAHEDVAPDRAVLSGQLVSKAKLLEDAKADNDKLVERVLAVAKQFDIPRDKIAASNVYISPEYVYNSGSSKQEQVGYIVSRSLSLTMDKLDIHERVLSALVENGIEQINGVSFTIADPESRENVLRVKAVQNARERAQLLATAAGAKLGKAVSIAMDGAGSPPVPMARGMVKAAMAEMSVAPSLPGTQTLGQRVSVTFELQ